MVETQTNTYYDGLDCSGADVQIEIPLSGETASMHSVSLWLYSADCYTSWDPFCFDILCFPGNKIGKIFGLRSKILKVATTTADFPPQ